VPGLFGRQGTEVGGKDTFEDPFEWDAGKQLRRDGRMLELLVSDRLGGNRGFEHVDRAVRVAHGRVEVHGAPDTVQQLGGAVRVGGDERAVRTVADPENLVEDVRRAGRFLASSSRSPRSLWFTRSHSRCGGHEGLCAARTEPCNFGAAGTCIGSGRGHTDTMLTIVFGFGALALIVLAPVVVVGIVAGVWALLVRALARMVWPV
jgi:hypothetical protein